MSTLTAPMSELARVNTTPQTAPVQDAKGRVHLTSKSIKCTLVVDATQLALATAIDGKPRAELHINVGDRQVQTSIAMKSLRKALTTIAEHGAENVAAILQGRLVREGGRDIISDAGLSVQIKASKKEDAVASNGVG